MRSMDYVEMTTTSIAGTLGDGAITCTAIANTPTFTLAFGAGAATVMYVIEDVVNKKFEKGIGSVAGNVLTRTKPQLTWSGTVFVTNSVVALQFGSTPASGNVLVRMASLAENSMPATPQPQSLVAGDSWRDYPFTAHLGANTGNGSGGALTISREYYAAFKVERAGSLAGFQFQVSTAAAGSLKAALYSCGFNGLPAQKIVDFVTTSVSTTGVKTDTATGSWNPTTPPYLTPGWYFLGYISDVACSLLAFNGNLVASPTPLGRKDAYGYGNVLYIAGSYATGLPAVPALTGGTLLSNGVVGTLPMMGVKVTP